MPRSTQRTTPAFISTVHDPNAALLQPLLERGEALSSYPATYVSATDRTAPATVEALRRFGVRVEIRPTGEAGTGRRRSLINAALDGHPAYLYCDLDRWLHWVDRFPEELAGMPERVAQEAACAWYVCLGRTERAFATHPEVQQAAERATSRALELVIGCPIDATAGGCWLTPEAAGLVLAGSTETSMGTDLEWPALVWRRAPERLDMIRVEGLEFESAAFAEEAIAAAGSVDAWTKQVYQQPSMWQARLQLAADSIAALNRVLALPEARPPRARRTT
jgi:hypothetical protein